MMKQAVRIGALAMAGTGFWGLGVAQADDFTIGGAFNNPNDVVLIGFSHPGGAFSAFTSQWNGGGPPFGPSLPAANPPLDGFDAQLQLFIGTGADATFDIQDDDGCRGGTTIDPGCIQTIGGTLFTGGDRDSLLDFAGLAAGDYTLGLTNWNNDPLERPSVTATTISATTVVPAVRGSPAPSSGCICAGSARS